MNRYTFINNKRTFNPALVLEFIKGHPGLTPHQIAKQINHEYGFNKTLPAVFAVVSVLKRQGKVKSKKVGSVLKYEAV